MTYEEAKLRQIWMHKQDIKNRLHRINPERYPEKGSYYSAADAIEVHLDLWFKNPNYKDPFQVDLKYWKLFRGK